MSQPAPATQPAIVVPPQFQRAIEAGKSDYQALLQRAKGNDQTVDFFALRIAYSRTPGYSPIAFLAPLRSAQRELAAKDYSGALAQVVPHLERNYVDMWAHFVAAEAYRGLGKTAEAAHHAFMERGLRQSLLAPQRGQSFEDAIVVISVVEEYVAVYSLGHQPQGQRLINRDGMMYDELKLRHRETGNETLLFFIANIPMSNYGALLGKPQPQPAAK